MTELFLSHSSKDKELATALARLLSATLYGSKKGEISGQIFFSSAPESGLIAGDSFDKILEELKAAKQAVVLVTPESAKSVAVLAEMAIALNAKKLVPVSARKGHEKLLTWPFGETHAVELDSASAVQAYLTKLGGKREGLEEECSQLAAQARKSYVAPRTRLRIQRAAMAMAVLVMAGLAAWGAYEYGVRQPKKYEVTSARFEPISGRRVKLRSAFTLPERRLTERLFDIHSELGGGEEEAEIHRLVEKAIRKGNIHGHWLLPDGAPEGLIKLATRWRKGYKPQYGAGSKGCGPLEQLDKEWCECIATLDENQRGVADKIDTTRFAVVEVKGEPELRVLTTREEIEIGGTRLTVATIHSKERGEDSHGPEFVVLVEKPDDFTAPNN
ncbi:MAG: toll/interleukin-1 receptor domain-containing protein [Bryobacterales bacterium]|nr:toll/interleukin-1 receptor domain-containing protein [Bryobacterales bacterium]